MVSLRKQDGRSNSPRELATSHTHTRTPPRRLQLLSAPYFLFVKGESLQFWWQARFRSTYQPGFAFVMLVVVITVSAVWSLNPTEGYVLLALHTYSSLTVALHYGKLSGRQRKKFLSFSGVKQLRARKSQAQDPMEVAEALSGRPLAGNITVLNSALLRLVAEQEGTAAAFVEEDATFGGLRVREDGPEALLSVPGGSIRLGSFAARLLTEYCAMRLQVDAEQDEEDNDGGTNGPAGSSDSGPVAVPRMAPSAAKRGRAARVQALAAADGDAKTALLVDDSAANALVLEETSDDRDEELSSAAASTTAAGTPAFTPLTSPSAKAAGPPPLVHASVAAHKPTNPDAASQLPPPLPLPVLAPSAASEAEAALDRRTSSGNNARLRSAWGALASFRPYRWSIPTRLVAREIAARASSGSTISLANLRMARVLAVLAILAPAVQFAYDYPCFFRISTGACDPSAFAAVQPNVIVRIIVFALAALGAYSSAFVILRLNIRIQARSRKRLVMLRALADCTDFSASLRTKLPFFDLRLPDNACTWTSMLDTLVGYYLEKDNVNSYEILSTIMAWNALVCLAFLVFVVLLAFGVVRVQLQTLAAFAAWGILLSGGLCFAMLEEATTNELLEGLSRRLQHLRSLIAEEITALRQANVDHRGRARAARGGRLSARTAANDDDDDEAGLTLARRRAAVENQLSEEADDISDGGGAATPNDGNRAGLQRGGSKVDVLERRSQAMRSVAQSARSLTPAQREEMAETMQGSLRVLEAKIGELSSGAERSRLFGIVISFPLLRGFVAAVATTALSLTSVVLGNMTS